MTIKNKKILHSLYSAHFFSFSFQYNLSRLSLILLSFFSILLHKINKSTHKNRWDNWCFNSTAPCTLSPTLRIRTLGPIITSRVVVSISSNYISTLSQQYLPRLQSSAVRSSSINLASTEGPSTVDASWQNFRLPHNQLIN